MINSVNALDFLKPKLINMEKFNSTTPAKLIPPSSLSQTKTFVTISSHHHNHQYRNNAIDSHHQGKQQHHQFLFKNEMKQERVRVQHLENHTNLQNNKCWNNFRTLYNISASSGVNNREMSNISQIKDDSEVVDVVNIEYLPSTTITPINIQSKSAFNIDFNSKKYHNNHNNTICGNINYNIKMDASRVIETNNNYQFYCKQYCKSNYDLINKQAPTTLEPQLNQRTEDQNNAYRHIESVHNYAKSKSYEDDDDDNQSPNASRHSSSLDDEDDDDDDAGDNGDDVEADYDNDEDIESNDVNELADDLDADYEGIFNKRRHKGPQKLSTSYDGAPLFRNKEINNSKHTIVNLRPTAQFVKVLKDPKIQSINVNNKCNASNKDEEVNDEIDVETVESQSSPIIPDMDKNSSAIISIGDESAAGMKPDHHARRPMNAFLIFCKRHRAIVKERYKNLENRAITKILGDWWASLEVNDKKCFTNLAQQNKDAFFCANPNFKWYKLPAPPLRTLTTRPANNFGPEYQEDNEAINGLESMSNNTRSNKNNSNFFKLADEAQMGDLSQLMQDKSKATRKQCTTDLQQVLGETSQFMSAHITANAADVLEENHLKRRYHNENSFSSNSSEEDFLEPKKKSARSCKGKRYQELINSGQISTAVKKSKSSIKIVGGGENLEGNVKQNYPNVSNLNSHNINSVCQKRSVSESENILSSYELNSFDLEERIKELPALSLDDYLLRKRNIKKKKKFSSNGKKRGQRSNANNNSSTTSSSHDNNSNLTEKITTYSSNEHLQQQQQYQPPLAKHHQQAVAAAVGSQKRKARKESITRRDVSAIEQELASLLPLTINGCCYFQEAPTALKYMKAIEKDTGATTSATQQQSQIIIPLEQNSSLSSVSIDISNNNKNNSDNTLNDNISSTSDLLILAEVAANRTELKH